MADDPPFPSRLSETPESDPVRARVQRHLRNVREAELSHGAAVHRVGVRLARGEGLPGSAPRRRRRLVPWLVGGGLTLAGVAFAWYGVQSLRDDGDSASETSPSGGGDESATSATPPRLATGAWSASSDEGGPAPDEEATPSASAEPDATVPDGRGLERADGRKPDLACGPFVPGRALTLCAGTYLSGPGADVPTAVQIASDRTVVWGGTLDGIPSGATVRSLIAPGGSAVVRFGRTGREALSVSRVGETIADLELDASDRIVVLGAPFGLAVLDAPGERVLWQRPVHGTRLALAVDGTMAVLDDQRQQVSLVDTKGDTSVTFPLALPREGRANDVAIDSVSRQVFVTGALIGVPSQPFLRAYSFDGRLRWQNWGGTVEEARGRDLTAGTRGERLVMGPDGKLYYLGRSDGANSVHGRDPRDLHKLQPTVMIDRYTEAARVANYAVMFLARVTPGDGAIESAIFHLTRNDKDQGGKGRSMNPSALAVDEAGRVTVGGYQNCCMEGQAEKSVAGVSLHKAVGRDAFVLMLSRDLKQRLVWTTFGGGGQSVTMGVAVRAGLVAMTAAQQRAIPEPSLALHEPVQDKPLGGPEAYLAVWPAP